MVLQDMVLEGVEVLLVLQLKVIIMLMVDMAVVDMLQLDMQLVQLSVQRQLVALLVLIMVKQFTSLQVQVLSLYQRTLLMQSLS